MSVQTTDTVRLVVTARDAYGGAGRIVFYASFSEKQSEPKRMRAIGEVGEPPYEFLWDCTKIPDQIISFDCQAIDASETLGGRRNAPFQTKGPRIVLDRNPAVSPLQLTSHERDGAIMVDGGLDDWKLKDSIRILNNDNETMISSFWDKKYLYLGIVVHDNSLIVNSGNRMHSDAIMILFDIEHDHSHIMSERDYCVLISPDGAVFECDFTGRTPAFSMLSPGTVMCGVVSRGSLNVDGDRDFGYDIELRIPHEKFHMTGKSIENMGFEVMNCDVDYTRGSEFWSGWTCSFLKVTNKSEWGDLCFKTRSRWIARISYASCVCVVFMSLFIFKFKRKAKHEEQQKTCVNEHIAKACRILETGYMNPDITRDHIAGQIGLNSSYFGRLFKEETSITFTEYVIKVRIGKAKELLALTVKNVNEIAYETGFQDASYFGRAFKRHEGMTPLEYRSICRKTKGKKHMYHV